MHINVLAFKVKSFATLYFKHFYGLHTKNSKLYLFQKIFCNVINNKGVALLFEYTWFYFKKAFKFFNGFNNLKTFAIWVNIGY